MTTPLTIDNTTKNIELNYDTTDFTITNTNFSLANQHKITGISAPLAKTSGNILGLNLTTSSGLQASSTGLEVYLATSSGLSKSSIGLSVDVDNTTIQKGMSGL